MVTKEIELAMALSDAGMQKAVSETIQRSTG